MPKSTANKILRADGNGTLYWGDDIDTNTWPTKLSQLTNDSGYITGITKAMVTTALGYTPPSSDTNTHFTTRIYAGESGTAANAASTSPYIKVTDDNTYRNQIRLIGGGATTVTSDANGNITITSTDTNTDTDTWRPVSDSVSSTDSSTAASSKAVKTAYDLAASKTSNTGTVTKVSAGTGLTGGDITTTGTIALATSGVTAGTYKRVTVDAYGRVTSGDNTDADTNTARL